MRHCTRFSNLHPYPAMMADELADAIAKRLIQPDARVLDPFCGTARTLLAAADFGVDLVGIDVNPLALLVAEAKAADLDLPVLERVLATLTPLGRSGGFDLECGRKVEWFSGRAKRELSEIIMRINQYELDRRQLLPLAAVLSATAREVSYCRKDQWKLHRMVAEERKTFNSSPWNVFSRRLTLFVEEARSRPRIRSRFRFYVGDSTDLLATLKASREKVKFDVIVTSPPYGDSRTTLGYGGISSLCLGVLQHLKSLNAKFVSAGEIDRSCLGGSVDQTDGLVLQDIGEYWRGGRENSARARVVRYLSDLRKTCEDIGRVAANSAHVVFVVACRNAGGRRLYLREFVRDSMSPSGFEVVSVESREIRGKTLPWTVNATGASGNTRRVATMRSEFVITMRR